MNIRETVTNHTHSYNRLDISSPVTNLLYVSLGNCPLEHFLCVGSLSSAGKLYGTSQESHSTDYETLNDPSRIRDIDHKHTFDEAEIYNSGGSFFATGSPSTCPFPHGLCQIKSSGYTIYPPVTNLIYSPSSGLSEDKVVTSIGLRRTGGLIHHHYMEKYSITCSSRSFRWWTPSSCGIHSNCIDQAPSGSNAISYSALYVNGNSDSEKC